MKYKTLLAPLLTVALLHAQVKPADPFVKTQADDAAAAAEAQRPKNISICLEMFSLPLDMAARLERERPGDAEFYKQLVAGGEKGTVRLESLLILRAKSGQKGTTESISERIYPTEYEPAQIPNSVGANSGEQAAAAEPGKAGRMADGPSNGTLAVPATPKSFDTRNSGATLEIEPTLSEDSQIVDLRMIPEIVTLVGRDTYGEGISVTEMPNFESQRISSQYTVMVNQPFLIGTISRPPVSEVDKDSASRVWFAFVTASLAKL